MKAYFITDIGQLRTVNQDYIFSSLEPVGKLPNLFIVADGMGGHNAGDFASQYAVGQMVSFIENAVEENPVVLLSEGIQKTNTAIIEKSMTNSDFQGMGTTMVAATIQGSSLYVANVGDSRLYVIQDKITQITRDHSLVEEMVEMGELTRDSQGYQLKKNVITRAIGATNNIFADIFELELKNGDYVLMCSDGLTNMVTDEQIETVIRTEEELSEKVRRLVALANENGGKDNIAVLLVEFELSEVNVC